MTKQPHSKSQPPEAAPQLTELEPEAALDEIAALVGDRWPIGRQVQDIIKRAKSK